MAQVQPVPSGYTTVTPFLQVRDAQQALDFCKKAFAAEERYKMQGPDGKLVHAEISIGNSVIMLAQSMGSEITTSSFYVYVENCDSLFRRAVNAGAKTKMELRDAIWGDRCGTVSDPFGNTWTVATHREDVPADEIERRYKEEISKK